MKFVHDLSYDGTRGLALTIGVFDGLHLGHQSLVARTLKAAHDSNLDSAILTFSPHPMSLLTPEKAPRMLVTPSQKRALLLQCGVDYVFEVPFTRAFSEITAEVFIEAVLKKRLDVKQLILGENFRFGKNNAGTVALLQSSLGASVVQVMPTLFVHGRVVSSSAIRGFIQTGQVEEANLFLGRPYEIEGVVVRGLGRGRQLGVPTANLNSDNTLIPKSGVYSAYAILESGERFRAALNIGTRPSFEPLNSELFIEAHLLGCDLDLYGQRLKIAILSRIRDEKRFESVEQLKKQITADLAKVSG